MTANDRDPPRLWVSVLLAGFAAVWATGVAIMIAPPELGDLDVDGWGHQIARYAPAPLPLRVLWSEPSLWKGPIVPTLFQAAYVVWPSIYSVLGLNILAFALAVGLVHRTCVVSGLDARAALVGVIAWIVFPPHRIVYGHYFAEPIIALFSVGLFTLVVRTPKRALLIGAMAGLTLMARPPFLIIVGILPFVMLLQLRTGRGVWLARYTLAFMVTFLPWGVRNWLVTGSYVPFTVEGGQTLFHGSYLPLDEIRWQVFKLDPAVAELEGNAPTDPVARMHYLSNLAKEQVLADPAGQAVRSVRKAMRFWVVLERDTWWPELKTGLVALVMLPLAGWTLWRNCRVPIVRWAGVWVIGLWLIHAAVFGVARYNFPIMPLALVLAASAVWPPTRNSTA